MKAIDSAVVAADSGLPSRERAPQSEVAWMFI
jgi:hypothetical protein